MSFISVSLAVVLIYPRMTAVHNLLSEVSDFLDSLIVLFFSSPDRIYNFHADMGWQEADGSLTTLIILLTASACVLETRRHAQRNNIQSKQSI